MKIKNTFLYRFSANYNLIRSKFVTNPDNKKKYDVYKKINFPKHWKLKQSELFDDILTVVAQPSYTFYKTEEYEKSLIDAGKSSQCFVQIIIQQNINIYLKYLYS